MNYATPIDDMYGNGPAAAPVFHFPFDSFFSAAGFQAFVQANRARLDVRYAYETACTASAHDPLLVSAGSCGLCLRATGFSTRMPDPDRNAAHVTEPNWREQQMCGCAARLNARFRALLHYIASDIDPPPWTRLLLLGEAQSIEARLHSMAALVSVRARSGRLLRPPVFGTRAYHLVVSSEHLHAEPAIDAVLAGFREALMPGGHLVFTAPFDTASASSVPALPGKPGVLGWDILDRLVQAGFDTPAAHLFWSEEFGYLGPFNLIFSAAG